jgi:hypothetical protein
LRVVDPDRAELGRAPGEAEQQRVAQIRREAGNGGIGQHIAQPMQGRIVELDVAGDIAFECAREIFRGVAGLAAGFLIGPDDQVGDDADDRGNDQVSDRHDRPAREHQPSGHRSQKRRVGTE